MSSGYSREFNGLRQVSKANGGGWSDELFLRRAATERKAKHIALQTTAGLHASVVLGSQIMQLDESV